MNDSFNELNSYLQEYRNKDCFISDLQITSKEINGKILYGFYFKVNSNKQHIYLEI